MTIPPQSYQFAGPTSINPRKVELLKKFLDITYKDANIETAGPADEESMYNLGANHAFYDTLEILHDVDGDPVKKDHTKRNVVLVFTAGVLVGTTIERRRVRRAWDKFQAKHKLPTSARGWVDYSKGMVKN